MAAKRSAAKPVQSHDDKQNEDVRFHAAEQKSLQDASERAFADLDHQKMFTEAQAKRIRDLARKLAREIVESDCAITPRDAANLALTRANRIIEAESAVDENS